MCAAEEPEVAAADPSDRRRERRRKMTVRLSASDFRRCQGVVERLGTTYQSVLEHAIRSHFEAAAEPGTGPDGRLSRQSAANRPVR
jgi:hypothetical protein